MFWFRVVLAVGVFLAASAVPANGGVASLDGPAQSVSLPPISLIRDVLESSNLLIFTETQGVQLPAPLSVDIGAGGRFDVFSNQALRGVASLLPAGTVVDSYLVHFDTPGRPRRQTSFAGEVSLTFAEPILGVVVRGATLQATDGLLGLAQTAYLRSNIRGLENRDDDITLSEDMRTLTFVSLRGSGRDLDQVRIVTRGVVPEPATMMLGCAGLLLLALRLWAHRMRLQEGKTGARLASRSFTPPAVPR